MGGDPQPTTTTTQVVLSPEQRELLNLAMPGFREFAANPPKQYEGSGVAPVNANQIAGQNMALGGVATQNQLGSNAAASTNNILTNALDVNHNPALQGFIDAAVRPISQQLTETTLPAIRGGAVTTGNFGSSRQGIAEGLAAGRASQAVGDTTSKIASDAYGQGLDATIKALSLTPTVQASQNAGALTTSGVGDTQQAQAQALLNDEISKFNYDQLLPFLTSSELAGVVNGLPGGGATSTGTASSSSPLTSALGGAATGASLGSFLGPIGTAAGAGIGGLLAFLK